MKYSVLLGIVLISGLTFFTGCTKQEKTVAGVALGATTGGLIGSAVTRGAAGPIAGAVLGGTMGGLLGNAAGDDKY